MDCSTCKVKEEEEEEEEEDDTLDRLLLLQSHLSSTIDELVAQAFKVKSVSKEGTKEIECLSHVLSNMLSSLKPWVPRFQKALAESETESEQGTALDPLISPSPLVSWRANCTIQRGRPMFISSPLVPKRDTSMLVMNIMTPSLKLSPPKSCVLLQPLSETQHIKGRKSTPFPVGIRHSYSDDSESPGSEGLAFKYPELLGIHHISKSGIGNKPVQASPDWLMSPPKTCVLLEPPDEKPLHLQSVSKQQITKFKDDASRQHNQIIKYCNQESTPMWQEPQSSFQTGKRPGENTLKKELWTKFEAASTYGFQSKLPTVRENTQKGFLDLLEEASCDE